MLEQRPPEPPAPPPARRGRAAELYPRLRTHYDEPDLDVPFQPICGEFVQWVGRTADGGVVAMSTYRLHVQARRRRGAGVSVPLRLIDAAEVRDLLTLLVYCKDGRTVKCTLRSGAQCAEWARRLAAATAPAAGLADTFAAAYAAWALELPPASAPRALLDLRPAHHHDHHDHWFKKEVARLELLAGGAWRVTSANAEYRLCGSYPPLLVVPAGVGDEDLDAVARFRAARRLPAVVWRHRGNGAVLARSSQPEVGWLGWRSSEDERLLAALASACARAGKTPRLLIVDARSYTSAVTNRARGGGCECAQYYPGADIQFMSLPNIHHVRKSFHQLRQLLAEPPDTPNWHSLLERSLWLQTVSGLGRAASITARALLMGRPVLVHCSDGWDRTPQIVAGAQLLLDPYYRTIEGFRVLVEREWLDFGHKFADRCGHGFGTEDPNERSPVFLQWLDLVHQILAQYPCHFQFSQAYLMKLATHVHSGMFGTFLCNSVRERGEARVAEHTAAVWRLLDAPAYRNHLYTPPVDNDQVLWADYSVRSLRVWSALYLGERGAEDEPEPGDADPPPPPLPPTGGMSKTRSCEDVSKEHECRAVQRRSSDPNLAPDLVRLAGLSPPSSDSSVGAVDDDDSSHTPPHQTDGVRLHVENGAGARLMTSNSSSLERELAPLQRADDGPVFVQHHYEDLLRAQREAQLARERHISIGWRSVSESSQHTDSSADTTDGLAPPPPPPLPPPPLPSPPRALVNGDRASSTEASLSDTDDEAETEAALPARRATPASQDTLCPNSPSSRPPPPRALAAPAYAADPAPALYCPHCCFCCRRASSDVTDRSRAEWTAACCGGGGRGTERGDGRVLCECGGGGAVAARDPLDGLPTAHSPVQARLHQIILRQKLVVEELSAELRAARAALRRLAGPGRAASEPRDPHEPHKWSSDSEPAAAAPEAEVEVGEEAGAEPGAAGVAWVPDHAAERCQGCRNHFWLARRRHHCRRCGGVFCGSCSAVGGAGAAAGGVRVCAACALR